MKILAACEESQEVTIAFRKLGFNAFSCDLKDCSGGHPEWHIKADALSILFSESWDIVIAFPPCTFLSRAGARYLYPNGKLNIDRYNKGLAAKKFFMSFYNSGFPHIAIENPEPLNIFELPLCSQVIQPYYFGHPFTKKTFLWLKGLPPLFSTSIVNPTNQWVMYTKHNSLYRSKTFSGVAAAMASQWSNHLM